MNPLPSRRASLLWVMAGVALSAAGGVVALRARPAPAPASPSLDALSLPELMEKVTHWNLAPAEEDAVARALVARGRPAAEALLASLRGDAEVGDRSLPYLARIRRDSPDPALRTEVDRALRDVFPLKILIHRTISDEEAQRQAALVGAKPGDMVEFAYDPMGSRTVGQVEVEVTSLRGLVELLAEENQNARTRLASAFARDYVHRFGDEVVDELKRAAREVHTARGAAMALAQVQRAQAGPFLVELLKDPEPALREAGRCGIEALDGDVMEIFPLLLEVLATEHRSAAAGVIHSMDIYLNEDAARQVLGALAAATDAPTRLSLLRVFGRRPQTEGLSLAPIEALQRDPDEEVARCAREVLDVLRSRSAVEGEDEEAGERED